MPPTELTILRVIVFHEAANFIRGLFNPSAFPRLSGGYIHDRGYAGRHGSLP
jgi:hypothetical protein